MPPGFQKFAEYRDDNLLFFEELKQMIEQPQFDPVKIYEDQKEEQGSDGEKKQKNMINAVLELVDTAYTGLTNDPLGAEYFDDSGTAPLERMGMLDIVKLIPQAIENNVVRAIEDPLNGLKRAGDYVLLLTYSTSMFSNYTTTRPESIGKSKDDTGDIEFTKSITGVPISPEVNYFFQSEWEYLYNGDYNAGKNLNAVTRLLFLVRLVCNYITVFSVNAVTTIVNGIRTAFAWSPPLGLILGELARAAFVAAESLIDVAALRTGHKVPLVKSAAKNEWVCSPRGIMKAVKEIASSQIAGDDNVKDEKGLSYEYYMYFFFISKALIGWDAAQELAKRTGDLIELNVINYKNGINADEQKMTEEYKKDDRFMLSDYKTDFRITTSASMRMLFLSMPLAQRGAGGVAPPSDLPLSVTDYRGY